jgi:hypothetical protein
MRKSEGMNKREEKYKKRRGSERSYKMDLVFLVLILMSMMASLKYFPCKNMLHLIRLYCHRNIQLGIYLEEIYCYRDTFNNES